MSKITEGVTMNKGAQLNNVNGIVHGERSLSYTSPEYRSWQQMRQRCLNPNHHAYQRYGGRGITICERWNEYANFLTDMGRRPTLSHTLDRKENSKSYSPDNCRWATKKEQGRNRCDNVFIEFNGKSKSIADWADGLNISRVALYQRLGRLGWSVERSLTTPSRKSA